MKSPATAPQNVDPAFAAWAAELQGLDPRSHAYQETLGALTLLAAENGVALSNGEAAKAQELPPGFVHREELAAPMVVPGAQFERTILPLRGQDHEVKVVELTSDQGRKVRVCDLRAQTDVSLKGATPKTQADQARVDSAFLRDLKGFADTRTARDTVEGIQGVCYSKVRGTKLRSYWLVVRPAGDQGDGVPLIARVGDCGNGTNYQQALYRRLFGMNMS